MFVAIVESGILFVPLGGVLYRAPFGRRLPVLHDHEHGVPVQPPEPAHVRHDVQPDQAAWSTLDIMGLRGFRRPRARSGETARVAFDHVTFATAPPRPTRSPTSASICPPAA
ncbi:MAG: hypothetical protein ACLTMP_00505 [Eggerthella lenta]